MSKTLVKPPVTVSSPVTKIESWSEVTSKLYLDNRQIVNNSKKVQPAEGATKISYTTVAGVDKYFYYADEVTILDTQAIKLKQQAERDLFKRFQAHEISAEQMSDAIALLG